MQPGPTTPAEVVAAQSGLLSLEKMLDSVANRNGAKSPNKVFGCWIIFNHRRHHEYLSRLVKQIARVLFLVSLGHQLLQPFVHRFARFESHNIPGLDRDFLFRLGVPTQSRRPFLDFENTKIA